MSVVDRRLVIVRQATAAVLLRVPVVTMVLVVVLSEPWKPDGEAHPVLVVAFMVAVGGAGLAGMLLMRRGSRWRLAGIIRSGPRPGTRRRLRP